MSNDDSFVVGDTDIADEPDTGNADTLYRAELRVVGLPGIVVPALTVMVEEQRGVGWSGVARVNPRLTSPEAAFDTLLRDGLAPGSSVLVRLVLSAGSGHEDTVVRTWPSVITSVNTKWLRSEPSNRDAFCGITFRDPLGYLRSRTIWAVFAQCSLGEILGGVLSNAAGGDGMPTREPVLAGMSVVRIRETLRDTLGSIPYTIAAGEPMGYWLSRICGHLGVRIEMRGDAAGQLIVGLHDGKPSETPINRGSGVWMTVNPRAVASATNLTLGAPQIGPEFPVRGGLLDTTASGGARRFGRPGPVETIITADQVEVAEAEKRAAFARAHQSISRVRVSMYSRQPGLLPGRLVQIDPPPDSALDADQDGRRVDGYASLFGANQWQVGDVSHLYSYGGYVNHTVFEKVGAGWRPAVPPEECVKCISCIVDDGVSESGKPIERDRLGRIPVKFPFFFEADDGQSSPPAIGATPWPPTLLLAPVEPIAGSAHGFVRDHRQGDSCRVAVVSPFYAEIVGFGYRADRSLSARVGDATMGMVVRQDLEEWRGMLFRPDEDLERELDDSGNQDEDS